MISSAYPFWWLALPVLLLPVWWHRQRRLRLEATALATARFLPASAPQQLRVWAWSDPLLLLLRCLLLLVLIVCLAMPTLAWRGDTVLVDTAADGAWATRQIAAAGFGGARRLDYCAPSSGEHCALQAGQIVPWLQRHQAEWRRDARLLVLAGPGSAAMPARMPRLAHRLELKVGPAAATTVPVAAAPPHRIVLAADPERTGAWRAMLAAFASAGTGRERYVIGDAPDAGTELLIWDRAGAPPPAWRAPLWWIGSAATVPELASAQSLDVAGLTLKVADSARGRLWSIDAPRDAAGAAAIYAAWQRLKGPASAWPMPALSLDPALSPASAPAPAGADVEPAQSLQWLMFALAALFFLERIVTHARRT
jgi:hypothetical protein